MVRLDTKPRSAVNAAAAGKLGLRLLQLGYQRLHRVLVHQNKRLQGITNGKIPGVWRSYNVVGIVAEPEPELP
jgi:hypothetical protein